MQFNSKAPQVLITGGLGHIGSYLIRSSHSYDVTVVDDLSTERYCSLFNFKNGEQKISFQKRDFDDLSVRELSQFDIIIHLAAKTNAAASFGCRDDIEKINVNRTSNLIDKASSAGIKLFVFPSSTSVYGVAKDIVTEDDLECVNPQSPYAESKIEIERILQSCKMPHVIFRFGTIFGTSPGMRFHTAVNKFCFQACIGEPLTVWKENFNQKRPYLDLLDASAVINLACCMIDERPHETNRICFNQIYNVATGNYTAAEVIQEIRKRVDVKVEMVNTPLLNQYSYEVSCRKISETGFSAKGSLKDGIKHTLELLSRCVS